MEHESKKNESIAELSYWYGFDVDGLPKDRQFGLLTNLRRVQAQERIFREMYEPSDYDGVYDLYFEAYGSEDLARAAKLDSLKQFMRSECEAARTSR